MSHQSRRVVGQVEQSCRSQRLAASEWQAGSHVAPFVNCDPNAG